MASSGSNLHNSADRHFGDRVFDFGDLVFNDIAGSRENALLLLRAQAEPNSDNEPCRLARDDGAPCNVLDRTCLSIVLLQKRLELHDYGDGHRASSR